MKTKECRQCEKEYNTRPKQFCSRECFLKYIGENEDYKKYKRTAFLKIREKYKEKYGKPLGFQAGELNPAKHPTAKQKMSQFRKGVPTSPEVREKQRIACKIAFNRPEIREKRRKLGLGRKLSEEIIKKIILTKSLKPKKTSTLKNSLDTVFSRYIRLKYSKNGMVGCFTCSRIFPINEMDNGHFVSRQHLSLRYSEKNCHPQCRSCNRFQEGAKDEYSMRLVEKYGVDILKELNFEKNKITKDFPYMEKIAYYKNLIKDYPNQPNKLKGFHY